ncbi:MAG TPA: DUF222 domain-containing protein [Jatrophihabitans sp.]|jgi:hypothetical protein|uniref:HNH endonuclease signature motif containing protein n=1 Tax=Jatrophihabitans sp. TaxID=1932789 RepID=UPI002E0655D0|nr:DUF222 domain-containing protein [Jatrophihabitans sp.]
MNESAVEAVAAMHAAVDSLLELGCESLGEDEFLEVWRELEAVSRRMSAVDHRFVAQAAARHLDHRQGASSLVSLMRQVLHVGAPEAKRRVHGAEAAGPRVGLTGEVLPPIFQRVAAAQSAGAISAAHASVIVSTIEGLPDQVSAEHGEALEAGLVEQARQTDPVTLAAAARQAAYALDQDGQLHDAASREKRRDLRFFFRADGSARIEGELTAEAAERLRTALDAFGKPRPSVDGGQDPRTPGQRRHDALLDLVKAAQRAQQVPDAGGLTTTLILTVPAADWARGTGTATTGHGASVPVALARQWVDGETRVVGAVLDRMRKVIAYSSGHRIFTEGQRLAMISRDRGCSFPDCDAPPQWCESHHVIPWAGGGPTSINNGALLCGFHHREHERSGWSGVVIDGVPQWIPPRWIDPDQVPRRNRMHEQAVLV